MKTFATLVALVVALLWVDTARAGHPVGMGGHGSLSFSAGYQSFGVSGYQASPVLLQAPPPCMVPQSLSYGANLNLSAGYGQSVGVGTGCGASIGYGAGVSYGASYGSLGVSYTRVRVFVPGIGFREHLVPGCHR